MIGNDIIDLPRASVESNWERKGFLNKIFTPLEQNNILSSDDPERVVWILWSMKESAYKANVRITTIREYAPKKIECKILNSCNHKFHGEVNYDGRVYKTFTHISKTSLHTIAISGELLFSNIIKIEIENFPVNYFGHLKNLRFISGNESIVKNNFGVPHIFDNSQRALSPVSISHHGKFLALVRLK